MTKPEKKEFLDLKYFNLKLSRIKDLLRGEIVRIFGENKESFTFTESRQLSLWEYENRLKQLSAEQLRIEMLVVQILSEMTLKDFRSNSRFFRNIIYKVPLSPSLQFLLKDNPISFREYKQWKILDTTQSIHILIYDEILRRQTLLKEMAKDTPLNDLETVDFILKKFGILEISMIFREDAVRYSTDEEFVVFLKTGRWSPLRK